MLTLLCKHADVQGQLTESSLTFLDIGEMASHARTMPARLIPPLVTGHKIHWIEGQHRFLGEELLFAMGFPSDIQARGLSQRALRRIAGNIMSVDFLCVLNVLLLLFVDFDLCYMGDDDYAPIGAEFPNAGCDSTEAWAAGPIKLAPHKATSLKLLTRVHLPGLDRASLRNASQPRARKTSSLVRFDMPEPPATHFSSTEVVPPCPMQPMLLANDAATSSRLASICRIAWRERARIQGASNSLSSKSQCASAMQSYHRGIEQHTSV